ncbi:MAG TPA: FMN-binding protein [Trebonia sp.]|jgi:uncharacterized protein with FMN-binding domain
MRRAILAITATVAGIVALLSFKTHSPAQQPIATGATGAAGATDKPTTAAPPGGRAVTGNVANTAYGPVQVQVVINKSTKIIKVNILEQPTATEHDLQIGQFAFPKLISETLSAQSARIDSVSGATYTSGGYIKSLQSALDGGA